MLKKKLRRITIKVGTRVLTDEDNRIDERVIRSLVGQISTLMEDRIEVLLVTSGAIGAGLGLLRTSKRNKSLSDLQAIASIGQNHLMDIYNKYFIKKGVITGQILLTQDDFNDRKRFLNIRYTINSLLKLRAVPLINENDTVSTEEIKCGDNDRLSSLVADAVNSDMIIILTDVDGLYDYDGNVISSVKHINKDIKSFCRKKSCDVSTGGMASKLEAVKKASNAGIEGVIARGKEKNIILDIVAGKDTGTRFYAREVTVKAKKRWIAYGAKSRGSLVIDEGAAEALVARNKSLLPGGVAAVKGKFKEGDIVEIISGKGAVIARGLTNYTDEEICKIKGKRSDKIEQELGYKDYDEIVHRDNLVIIKDDDV
jgi:glutamate 5-kinase